MGFSSLNVETTPHDTIVAVWISVRNSRTGRKWVRNWMNWHSDNNWMDDTKCRAKFLITCEVTWNIWEICVIDVNAWCIIRWRFFVFRGLSIFFVVSWCYRLLTVFLGMRSQWQKKSVSKLTGRDKEYFFHVQRMCVLLHQVLNLKNEEVQTHEMTAIYVKELDIFLTMKIMDTRLSFYRSKSFTMKTNISWMDQWSETQFH